MRFTANLFVVCNGTFPFSWNWCFYPLLYDGHMLGQKTDIGQSLLADNGCYICLLGYIACVFYSFKRDNVPFRFIQCKVSIQLEINRVITADLTA